MQAKVFKARAKRIINLYLSWTNTEYCGECVDLGYSSLDKILFRHQFFCVECKVLLPLIQNNMHDKAICESDVCMLYTLHKSPTSNSYKMRRRHSLSLFIIDLSVCYCITVCNPYAVVHTSRLK